MKKLKASEKPTVVANDPNDLKGTLKIVGGSQSDKWNNVLANQAVSSSRAISFALERRPGSISK
jgi:hypothetical protein